MAKIKRTTKAAVIAQLLNNKNTYRVSKLVRKLRRKGISTKRIRKYVARAASQLSRSIEWTKGPRGGIVLVLGEVQI